MRMRASKEGSCDPIAPLELPYAMHAFHRVSSTDKLNLSNGELQGAEEYFLRATQADPNDGEILMQYAKLVLEQHHDIDRALVYFERAAQATPQDSNVLAAYASFLRETEDDENKGGKHETQVLLTTANCSEDSDAADYFQKMIDENLDNPLFLKKYAQFLFQYEDVRCQEAAQKTVPVDELEEKALVSLAKEGNFKPSKIEQDYAFLLQLLFWFKQSSRWVNSPSYHDCGNKTENWVMTAPLPSEALYRADTVELYRCTFCSKLTHFPQYNDPMKVLSRRTMMLAEPSLSSVLTNPTKESRRG